MKDIKNFMHESNANEYLFKKLKENAKAYNIDNIDDIYDIHDE